MADPNIIGGQIPFGPGGNPYQGGIGNLGNAYQTSYNSALSQNQAMYNNILQGYQQTMAKQTSAQDAIAGGYTNLYNNVLGGIQGIGESQKQNIQDVYAQQKGATAQSLISRGLGNTTVSDTMQRGLGLDEQKAQIALANQIAQLTAGYQSSLGLAGLNQANTANMQNTGLAGQQLNWMNSVTAQYPNTAAYNQLAQMSGAASQADRDRAAMLATANRGGGTVGAGGFGGAGFRSGGSGSHMGAFQPYAGWGAMAAPTNYGGGGGQATIYPSGEASPYGKTIVMPQQYPTQTEEPPLAYPEYGNADTSQLDFGPDISASAPPDWQDFGDYWGQDFSDY